MAPQEVLAPQPADSCAAAALPGQVVPMACGQKPRIQYVRSPVDTDWNYPFKDQLEPQLFGGPNPKKSYEKLRFHHNRVPKLDDNGFKAIFPGKEHSIICVVLKNWSRRYIHFEWSSSMDPQCNPFIGSMSSSSRWWLSFGVEIGKMRPNSNTWWDSPSQFWWLHSKLAGRDRRQAAQTLECLVCGAIVWASSGFREECLGPAWSACGALMHVRSYLPHPFTSDGREWSLLKCCAELGHLDWACSGDRWWDLWDVHWADLNTTHALSNNDLVQVVQY